jgi:hypothetical protein
MVERTMSNTAAGATPRPTTTAAARTTEHATMRRVGRLLDVRPERLDLPTA